MRTGPQRSRALRALARRSDPLTARTVARFGVDRRAAWVGSQMILLVSSEPVFTPLFWTPGRLGPELGMAGRICPPPADTPLVSGPLLESPGCDGRPQVRACVPRPTADSSEERALLTRSPPLASVRCVVWRLALAAVCRPRLPAPR